MSTIFDALKALVSTKEKAALESYDAAVRSVAKGDKITPEKLLKLLEDAGKTAEQLEKDVAAEVHKNELRKEASTLQARQAEVAKLKSAVEKLDAEFTEFRIAFEQKMDPLELDLKAAIAAETKAQKALEYLHTLPGAEYGKSLLEAEARIVHSGKESMRLEREAEKLGTHVAAAKLKGLEHPADVERLAGLQKLAADAKKELEAAIQARNNLKLPLELPA